jgi:uncharacterized protein YueI
MAVLICSPNVGLLDNWLPVLSYLKEKNNMHISIIFPTGTIIDGLRENHFLRALTNEICDDFFVKNNEVIWRHSNNLEEICNKRKSSLLVFLNKALSKLKIIKFIKIIIKKIESFLFNVTFKNSVFGATQLVLCDVSELNKEYNAILVDKFNNFPKFSISHGLSLAQENQDNQDNREVINNVYCFLFSKKDINKYQSQYKIESKNLFITGIPRHSEQWISRVLNFFHGKSLFNGEKYALLISRPSNDFFYLSIEQKKQYLKLIKRVVMDKHGLCLAVKKHPGENEDDIFYDILGHGSYGIKWIFSDMHPYYLGTFSELCITFFSGISIDMAAIGVNSVELNNLSELDPEKNKHHSMYKNGELISPYSYYNLTKRISSESELDRHIKLCLEKEILLNHKNYNNYCDIFKKDENCILNISNIILKLI